jgi:hypothetical protein
LAFRVKDYVNLTQNFQIQFIASDLGDGSLVEAAIDDIYIYDVAATSISNLNPELGELLLYPNPANTTLNLELIFKQRTENLNVEFINSLGQSIRTEVLAYGFGNQRYTLDVKDLESGVYIVKIKTDLGESNRKLTITR